MKLQDFIMRYGTHYVKSAKFGGKLNVFKKIAKDSKMSEIEFAKASESEFSAMMSTLKSSYKQKSVKVCTGCFKTLPPPPSRAQVAEPWVKSMIVG